MHRTNRRIDLDQLFNQILKPALGCTEPVAVAFAASAAVQAACGWLPGKICNLKVAEDVRLLRVRMSRNIFKNSFAILIPNAEGHKGIVMAAALGVYCDPSQGMNLFAGLNSDRIRAAEKLIQNRKVEISITEDAPAEVYIEVEAQLEGRLGASMIRHEHSILSWLKCNGEIVFGEDKLNSKTQVSPEVSALKAMSLKEVIDLVEDLPEGVLALLRNTVVMNVAACRAGLTRPMGIGTGYFGTADEDASSFAQHMASLTAAGSDARMSGYPVEIMTSAGSGNQGIIGTIPVVSYAGAHGLAELKMLQSVALSHLVTMYLTAYIGYLSALCGVAIKAGIGAACGVVYAMGGGAEEVERAVKIMAATLTGMICDGAKIGCALKVSNAAEMAVRSAQLAMRKAEVPDDNGIVAPTAEQTILNLAELGRTMEVVDQKIIDIMMKKIETKPA